MIRASAEHLGNLDAGWTRRPPRLDRLFPLFQVGEGEQSVLSIMVCTEYDSPGSGRSSIMAGPWTIDSETLDSRAILIDFGDPDPDQQKAHELDGDLLEKNGVMRIEPIPAGGLSRLG